MAEKIQSPEWVTFKRRSQPVDPCEPAAFGGGDGGVQVVALPFEGAFTGEEGDVWNVLHRVRELEGEFGAIVGFAEQQDVAGLGVARGGGEAAP
jgi:hypothetical protein